MPVIVWIIARQKGNELEYYADEEKGTDLPRWIKNKKEAWYAEFPGWAEMVKEELVLQGFKDIFITTDDILDND
jgi:hypothetical protein